MAYTVIKFSAILMFIVVCAADDSEFDNAAFNAPPVSEVCLSCICQAATGCAQNVKCEYDACGLFRITLPYWTDGGKHTVNGESSESPTAFNNCVFDPYCAVRTVRGYMRRYAQDCNGDGQVDCYDYLAMHKKGAFGCDGDMPYEYVSVFNQCIAAAVAQQNYQLG